jgi:hypothetical protein
MTRQVRIYKEEEVTNLEPRYIRSEDNSLADALSRGSPFDDLELLPAAWRALSSASMVHTRSAATRQRPQRAWRASTPSYPSLAALEPPRWPRTGVARTPSCSRPRASCRAWLTAAARTAADCRHVIGAALAGSGVVPTAGLDRRRGRDPPSARGGGAARLATGFRAARAFGRAMLTCFRVPGHQDGSRHRAPRGLEA